jgi:hypothetical protein
MTALPHTKINLALVRPAASRRQRLLVTVYERLELADTIRLEPGTGVEVTGTRATRS